MDSFSHVMKSKSSNSAITSRTKNEKRCHISIGNAFNPRPHTVKKRGVYVEKNRIKTRNSKINLASKNVSTPSAPKLHVPRRPHHKMFVNSVLKILSKSSTGTQYPDTPTHFNYNPLESINPIKRKNRRTEIIHPRTGKPESKKRISPFLRTKRSKYYKSDANKLDDPSVIVLQPERQIVTTPSNYSERSYKDMSDPAVWAQLPCLNNADSKKQIEDILIAERKLSAEHNDNNKEDQKNKIKFELPKKSDNNMPDKKSDSLLYNFFVDLLQTTISVYNMKPEYIKNSKSNVKFEIDIEVADKLKVNDKCSEPTTKDDKETKIINEPSDPFNDQNEEIENLWLTKRYINNGPRFAKTLPRSSTKRKNKVTSPIPYSTPNRKPYISRKARKRRFISLLKRELQLDDFALEEPQTLYEALKIMAKTKRKAAAVRPTEIKTAGRNDAECIFDINRRRNIMRPARPKKVDFMKAATPVKLKSYEKVLKVRRKLREKPAIVIPVTPVKSLEVLGFEYKKPTPLEPLDQEDREDFSRSTSTNTIRNKFSCDTFWGNQSSKNHLYSSIFPERYSSNLRDFQSDLYSDEDLDD